MLGEKPLPGAVISLQRQVLRNERTHLMPDTVIWGRRGTLVPAAVENPLLSVDHRQRCVYREKDGQAQHERESDPFVSAGHSKRSPHPFTVQVSSVLGIDCWFRRMVKGPSVGVATEVLIRLGVENEIVPEEVNRPRRHSKHPRGGHVEPEPLMQPKEGDVEICRYSELVGEVPPNPLAVCRSRRTLGDELPAHGSRTLTQPTRACS